MHNTEHKKKSKVLNDKKEGDPALLHLLIKEGLQMGTVQEMGVDQLRNICEKCGISTSSQKSQAQMKIQIASLYETLLVGSCPCHGFTKVPGHTGGFYHIVCRHGVTVASKFLTLQESVRDAADLYLSLKVHPLLFVCDTPCGLARHMDCRCPDITAKLWGDTSGCFERPTLGKDPSQDIDIPELLCSEDRQRSIGETVTADPMVHPLTGTTRRYLMGDRFHSATNPHKSSLCLYHDINLCPQANAFKTSFQEFENNRKNVRRLRGLTVQSFGTQFFYNYLMDFNNYESIINKQRMNIEELLRPGQEVKRDQWKRFVIVDSLTS